MKLDWIDIIFLSLFTVIMAFVFLLFDNRYTF